MILPPVLYWSATLAARHEDGVNGLMAGVIDATGSIFYAHDGERMRPMSELPADAVRLVRTRRARVHVAHPKRRGVPMTDTTAGERQPVRDERLLAAIHEAQFAAVVRVLDCDAPDESMADVRRRLSEAIYDAVVQLAARSEPVACEVTGAGCDPSYAWSAPRLAKMLDEVDDAAGLGPNATHADRVLRIQQFASDALRSEPRVWLPGDTIPEGTWCVYPSGSVGRMHQDWVGGSAYVEVLVPDYDAAVAAEGARRDTGEAPEGAEPPALGGGQAR